MNAENAFTLILTLFQLIFLLILIRKRLVSRNKNAVKPGTRRVELSSQGAVQIESLYVTDHSIIDNRQFSSQPASQMKPSASDIQAVVQKVINTIKKINEREYSSGVTRDCDRLSEPLREVYPKLLRIINFYEGDLLKMAAQYQKDQAFVISSREILYHKNFPAGVEHDYETFLQCVIATETKRISLVGQAGSGKTVMVKRLVRDLTKFNDDLLIFFLNFSDFTDSQEITPRELLFRGLFLDSDAIPSYDWVLENQNKVMFIFDGLDQASWKVNDKAKFVGPYSTGKSSEIISNIFKGNLFPDVKVVYSSREHAVASLVNQLRPKMVVALIGLSQTDSEYLFKSFMGNGVEMPWEKVQTQFCSLIPLFSVPAFLTFTSIAFTLNPKNPPRSLTGVMQRLLEIFMWSGHIMERDISSVMLGLKKLSFSGLKNGKVLFHFDDVRNAGLDPEKIVDWIIKIPGPNTFNQFLLEGNYVLSFSHQILQEFLAAQYIIEQDYISFKSTVMQYLKDDHWSVVTRFVSGLLLNKQICLDLNAVTDVELKRELIRSSLKERFEEWFSSRLEVLAAIAESNCEAFIGSTIHYITHFAGRKLGASDAYIISSIIRHLVYLDLLSLRSCKLSSEILRILWDNIQHCKVKIFKLDISVNEIDDVGYATLGKIVKMCRVRNLSLERCDLSDRKLKYFLSEAGGSKILLLVASGNKLTDMGYAALGKVVKTCAVEELVLHWCGLNVGKLRSLMSESDGTKVRMLDVSINKLDKDTIVVLGEVVKRFSVEKLVMGNCGLTDDLLDTLLLSGSGAKLLHIDLSDFCKVPTRNRLSIDILCKTRDNITVEYCRRKSRPLMYSIRKSPMDLL